MFPSFHAHNQGNGRARHVELLTNLRLGIAFIIKLSYCLYVSFFEFGCSYIRSLRWRASFLSVSVLRVGKFRSKKQMVGFNACWIIAFVTHAKSVWHWAICHGPTYSMGLKIFTGCGISDLTVPLTFSSRVFPASSAFPDFAPKPGCELASLVGPGALTGAESFAGWKRYKLFSALSAGARYGAQVIAKSRHAIIIPLLSFLCLTFTPMSMGQGEGNTILLKFAGVPATTCSFIMLGLNTVNGDLYDCPAGAWVKTGTGGGGGGVTSISGDGTIITNAASVGAVTLTIAGTSGGIPFFNSATTWASSTALTANVLVKGGGAGVAPSPSLVTDSGTTLTYTGTGGLTTNGTGNQHTTTQGTITTSAPFTTHTATWNAGGVIFTNWLSNVTCTAAAANSIALGLGVAGTTWQFKYGTANCATPTLTVPGGTAAAVSIGPSVNSGLFWSGATTIVANAGTQIVQFTTTGPSIITGDLQTNPNCGANGTAANPSVVSCAAAAAGSFSCATNASTGTCTVNTTVVTANSEIFIMGRNDTTTGTRLGVTCNTGISTVLPEISAVVAATSFTINLGTFTTNPECFSYFIVN